MPGLPPLVSPPVDVGPTEPVGPGAVGVRLGLEPSVKIASPPPVGYLPPFGLELGLEPSPLPPPGPLSGLLGLFVANVSSPSPLPGLPVFVGVVGVGSTGTGTGIGAGGAGFGSGAGASPGSVGPGMMGMMTGGSGSCGFTGLIVPVVVFVRTVTFLSGVMGTRVGGGSGYGFGDGLVGGNKVGGGIGSTWGNSWKLYLILAKPFVLSL